MAKVQNERSPFEFDKPEGEVGGEDGQLFEAVVVDAGPLVAAEVAPDERSVENVLDVVQYLESIPTGVGGGERMLEATMRLTSTSQRRTKVRMLQMSADLALVADVLQKAQASRKVAFGDLLHTARYLAAHGENGGLLRTLFDLYAAR